MFKKFNKSFSPSRTFFVSVHEDLDCGCRVYRLYESAPTPKGHLHFLVREGNLNEKLEACGALDNWNEYKDVLGNVKQPQFVVILQRVRCVEVLCFFVAKFPSIGIRAISVVFVFLMHPLHSVLKICYVCITSFSS